jgi:hypothetical protein
MTAQIHQESGIPVSAFAIAAYRAAHLFGEAPDDIFDWRRKSRARLIALMALERVYPQAPISSIAAVLGMPYGRKAVVNAIQRAQNSSWFRNEQISDAMIALLNRMGGPPQEERAAPPAQPAPPERIAARFIPRVARSGYDMKPLHIVRPVGRVNVTAVLLGDPGTNGGFRVARG